ncbi:MAG: DUF362 domain-containing protein, partial [Candidatus Omnitrophota bacterium]
MRSKVSIVRCGSYDPAPLKRAIERSLDLIGGISRFVKPSDKVLVKPNLLSARLPDEAVDTHPEFVRAVVRIVKEAGGVPSIGDSPGSFFTVKSINHVYEQSGMKEVAENEGAGLVSFNQAVHINGYPIARAIKEFDLVINLPKFKTHAMAVLTGAVKNMYGLVPGLSKVQYHKQAPNINEFSNVLADIFEITKPALSIMDGIVGMDGDGPAAGRVREIGYILSSGDAVSLDAAFADMAGVPYSRNKLLRTVTERGLGKGCLDDIEILGESLSSARIKDFKLPKTAPQNRAPSFIAKYIARIIHFRPFINESLCEKCLICKPACPVDAITINKDKSIIDN